ncbi:hypothetical protein GDO78_011063 [Eleutherodactylus coqui]|uniref:Uncharacterized protein n=1 Tax=Eleutherodactylus coqui TaxID=57060 RepID=A0A8J6K7M7_ELECQ|nr:hypothetical protein GDO78_011063 [Eleutherodactylus coqui]
MVCCCGHILWSSLLSSEQRPKRGDKSSSAKDVTVTTCYGHKHRIKVTIKVNRIQQNHGPAMWFLCKAVCEHFPKLFLDSAVIAL